ncbi:MAG: glycosyltransferase family 4 protein [Synergistaceae bacterium]|nr:glycosyltransferase family 4 protein [Synergistaceae bacterium]
MCGIWEKMGYKVILYTIEPPNEKDYYYPESVKRVVIPDFNKLETRLAKLEQSLKEEHVDLFVYHAWLYPSLLYDMMLMKSLNIKFIAHAHGLFVWPYSHFNIYSANSHRIFGMCDAVATLADMSNDFYKLCGCASYLVQNPVPDYLKNINKTANLNSKKILWLGRIDAGKRLIDAVKIFERVHEKFPDYTLEVVGRDFDNSFPAVKKYCDAKNLNKFINFHGYQTDVNKFYQDAALMLMTSEMEGYPYTLLESKAHGLPTVMYSLPYLSLVKDGKGFVSAEIGDIEKMAELVCDLLLNEDKRIKLGQEARESFESIANYDYEDNWRKIFELACDVSAQEKIRREKSQGENALMIKMLINQLGPGIEDAINLIYNTRSFRLGKAILTIPRIILNSLKRVKKFIKRA